MPTKEQLRELSKLGQEQREPLDLDALQAEADAMAASGRDEGTRLVGKALDALIAEVRRLREFNEAYRLSCNAAIGQRDGAEARVRELEAFKAYVHKRLDEAGVPADPQPEENAKHGCRVEGRLNYLFVGAELMGNKWKAAEAEVARLQAVNAALRQALLSAKNGLEAQHPIANVQARIAVDNALSHGPAEHVADFEREKVAEAERAALREAVLAADEEGRGPTELERQALSGAAGKELLARLERAEARVHELESKT